MGRKKKCLSDPLPNSSHGAIHQKLKKKIIKPKKVSSKSTKRYSEKPVQRNAANARERARMRVLSKAFCRLKTVLPWVPADTKLSKLDTLRLASLYIHHLDGVLNPKPYDSNSHQDDTVNGLLLPSMKTTWPLLAAAQAKPVDVPTNTTKLVPVTFPSPTTTDECYHHRRDKDNQQQVYSECRNYYHTLDTDGDSQFVDNLYLI